VLINIDIVDLVIIVVSSTPPKALVVVSPALHRLSIWLTFVGIPSGGARQGLSGREALKYQFK
jgi:hypothetical protein